MTVVWGLALAVVLAGNGLILREVVMTRHDARAAYNVVRRAMAAAFLHAAPGEQWDEGVLRAAAWTRIRMRYPAARYADFWRECWAPVRAVGWQEGRWATVADWTEPEEGCQ